MTVKVAINGFGRIGRNILRAIVEAAQGHRGGRRERPRAGRDERPSPALRSVHGRFPSEVKVEAIDRRRRAEDQGHGDQESAELPHKELGVDIALECTGLFTADKAKAHLEAGAKRVLVSAPGEGADLTVVYGVNHDKLTKDHVVVSNASCTTNCLAPVAKVLHDAVDREGLHDDDPLLHQRPASSTRCTRTSTAPAPRRCR